MKLLQAQGVKASPEEIFSSLAQLKNSRLSSTKAAAPGIAGLRNSMLFQKLQEAKGGIKLEE